jgi:hypothetical protein
MTERRNYFVVDDYGDVWNEEPLPTFNQANQFRGMIRSSLNRITDLKITSKPRIRVEKVNEATLIVHGMIKGNPSPLKRSTFEHSDF